MKSRVLAVLVGSAVAAFLVGCAQVPSQSINTAKKAIEDAQKAGAEMYAPSQLKAAQVSFDLAIKEISAESKKLPFLRKYNKSAETLKSATSAAQSAQAAVEETKTQIRTETSAMIGAVQALADTAAKQLKAAPKKNAAALTAELNTVKAAIKAANDAMAGENLLAAKEKAATAQEKVTALDASIKKLVPAKKAKAVAKKK